MTPNPLETVEGDLPLVQKLKSYLTSSNEYYITDDDLVRPVHLSDELKEHSTKVGDVIDIATTQTLQVVIETLNSILYDPKS